MFRFNPKTKFPFFVKSTNRNWFQSIPHNEFVWILIEKRCSRAVKRTNYMADGCALSPFAIHAICMTSGPRRCSYVPLPGAADLCPLPPAPARVIAPQEHAALCSKSFFFRSLEFIALIFMCVCVCVCVCALRASCFLVSERFVRKIGFRFWLLLELRWPQNYMFESNWGEKIA